MLTSVPSDLVARSRDSKKCIINVIRLDAVYKLRIFYNFRKKQIIMHLSEYRKFLVNLFEEFQCQLQSF